MRTLLISIEINGKQVHVGDITYQNPADAGFQYAEEYRNRQGAAPISISLPFQNERFSPERTRIFFEGLLPEGFIRSSVADWLHIDQDDYLSILAGLGSECLGAVKVIDEEATHTEAHYEKLETWQVADLAKEGAAKSVQLVTKSHLSLTGASAKVGLYFDAKNQQWYLPIGEAPSTHIVKQSHIRLGGIVTNEQLCLLTARQLGIETPESFIIDVGTSEDGDVLFATRRYDRMMKQETTKIDCLDQPLRLHQEDFAQALGRASSEKYENAGQGYLKAMFDLLKSYSANPVEDRLKLWDIIVFDYLIGNTDNHIKNYSLLYNEDLKKIRLAPAYDIVSTAVYDSSTRDMGIAIDGKLSLSEITPNSFKEEAKNIGLGTKIAMERFDQMRERFLPALNQSTEFLKKEGFYKSEDIRKSILLNGGIANLQKC
ncbi:MAG: HipA domain-containing protein [bacterium]|nr:HipA domain-containing protein [bacterium]